MHIKHRDAAAAPQRNQQLSWLFYVAQTIWRLVVELTFIYDDASKCEVIVEQQNTMLVKVPVRYKNVTVRVDDNVSNVDDWW